MLRPTPFLLVNVARLVGSVAFLAVVFVERVPQILLVGFFAHAGFALLWLLVTETGLLQEERHPFSKYVPATSDIVAGTLLLLITGNIHSFMVAAYFIFTAINAVSPDRALGRYTWAAAIVGYTIAGLGAHLGVFPNVNLLAEQAARPTWLSLALAWLTTTLGLYLVYRLVSDFAYQGRRSLAEARRSQQEAEAANASKSQFLANMSHEIRTPMNAMLGHADLLEETKLDKEQHNHLATITRSARHLMSLLNDILDFSKIEAGQLAVVADVQRPAMIIDHVHSLLAEQINSKRLEWTLDMSPTVPERIHTDGARLTQIILNLMSNAVKFTEEGGKIALLADYDEPRKQLSIAVRDTGMGFPQERAEEIFQPFRQLDQASGRLFGGTGLGLAISRQLCQLLGGDIQVDSRLGEGSEVRFWIIAPAASGPDRHTVADVGDMRFTGRVLVVDDNQDNRELMLHFLKALGVDAQEASNGPAALQAVDKQDFDLIMMDLQMPGMDGLQTTQAMMARFADTPRPAPVVVAVTANAYDEDRRRCMEAGMRDFLPKPIERKNLSKVLARHLQAATD